MVDMEDLTNSNEEWVSGKQYKRGELVSFDTKTYTCLIGHKSLSVWEPKDTPALWRPSIAEQKKEDVLARELAEVKAKLDAISKENEALKTHIACSPDGEAFFAAQEDFQKLAATQGKSNTT